MSGFRWEIEASAGPAREGLVGGGARLLVRVRLFDGVGCDAPRPDAFTDLRPGEARELAFALLALAEHAERPERGGGVVSGQAVSAPTLPWSGHRLRLVVVAAVVSSDGGSRIAVACGTPVSGLIGGRGLAAVGRTAFRHVFGTLDSIARDRVGDDVPASSGRAVDGRSARRGEPRLVAERDDAGAVDGATAGSHGGRRLRAAPAMQLELGESRAATVWAGLPTATRETVLVVLARLIGAGAVEER